MNISKKLIYKNLQYILNNIIIIILKKAFI